MSSYATSPYVLEEQRLQGIVNKCCEDLNIALENIIKQERIIKQKADEQKINDNRYFASLLDTEKEYQRNVKKKNNELEEKKKYLQTLLHNIQLELDAFQKNNFELGTVIERQRQLMYQLENSQNNYEEIEKNIVLHAKDIESKIKSMSKKNFEYSLSYENDAEVKQGKKGVSLQLNKQNDTFNDMPKSVSDEFVKKLDVAMSSQYKDRFPSLLQLKSDFDNQPEYTKAAYAVKNMKKMDNIINQLQAINSKNQMSKDNREQLVLQYKAICEMLNESVDEELLRDEKSTRKLSHVFNKLFKRYQEQEKQKYVANAVATIMERHGIMFQDSHNSQLGNIMRFSMDDASVDVSGTENNVLIMEVSGKYSGEAPTLDERRKSVSSAQHFCSILKNIETELKDEYGIVFGKILTEKPSESTIAMEKDTDGIRDKKFRSGMKQKFDNL